MIQLREALTSDNAGLLNLTSQLPMEGKISIRIDRNPDFFQLLNLRGPGKLFVAENNGIIIGCISVSAMEILLNGNPEKVYYLADLRIHPVYVGTTLTARLLFMMFNYLRQIKADLIFCTAADGNEKVMPLFEGRVGFPKYSRVGIFKVYQIIPLCIKINLHQYTLSEIPLNGYILDIYRCFFKRHQFSPVINEDRLQGTRNLVVLEQGNIKACITLIDMDHSKQNVLIHLPYALHFLVTILRQFNKLAKIFILPEIGKPVKIMYIKAFAFMDGYERAFDLLIQHVRRLCFIEKYCFLAIGIHEKDPLKQLFTKYLHFTFNSVGFITSLEKTKDKVHTILDGVLFEDYSLI